MGECDLQDLQAARIHWTFQVQACVVSSQVALEVTGAHPGLLAISFGKPSTGKARGRSQ